MIQKIIAALFVWAFLVVIPGKGINAAEKVTLQLRWDHQFQFAGYYAAKWQGYYSEAGFDVEIQSAVKPGGRITSAVKAVAEGDADFGVGAADIIMAKDKGAPLVVLAVIFQQSAAEFYVREEAGLKSLADLTRLRVARRVNSLIDVELQAMLQSEGIDPVLVPPYPHEPGMDHLTEGRVDVIPGYRISAPYHIKLRGLKITTLRPSAYGIDFYGDSLFTHERRIERDQDAVKRFVVATLKGWEYALKHLDEVAGKITRELPRNSPLADFAGLNHFQMKGVRELTLYPIVQLGHVNPNRWRRMHAFLKGVGVIKGEFDAEDFIFDPVRRRQEKAARVQKILIIGLSFVFVLAALSLCWVLLLRRAVAKRTRALVLSNEELECEIKERRHAEKLLEETVKDLRETRDQLVRHEKLAVMGQLSGGIAHELRNPLGAIKNAVYFLNMTMEEAAPEMKETVGIIGREVANSERIITSLLNFARSKPPVLQKININRLVREILSQLAIPESIKVELRSDETLPDIEADPDQLGQVFGNLIQNAVQAMWEGGTLTIISEVRNPDWVIISFTDTGKGIDEDRLGKIFEPLFTTKSAGIGLGLSLTRSLTEGHGGTVEVESEEGKGTTFTVKLPSSPPLLGSDC
ncbi:ABC transporter substrate-binding protein [Desulfobacterales bacterium HSG2]|nr:ABC transporter substrate-binding protein [Desulfobacterales bacterium HSG2]